MPWSAGGSRSTGTTTVVDGHGQRDHSWGKRRLVGLRLDVELGPAGGRHALQATEVRLAGRSVVTGYVQSPGRALHELSGGASTETTALNGLVTAGEIDLPSAGLEDSR